MLVFVAAEVLGPGVWSGRVGIGAEGSDCVITGLLLLLLLLLLAVSAMRRSVNGRK